jgi:hypothetical protein
MITPINRVHPTVVHEVSHAPAQPKPDPHAQTPPVQKSGQLSHDQVTLRSAGQPDQDANRK